MNHWDKALESHNANHPDTVHVQADIKETDPRYIATSDILWASPECTNHSVAKGKKRITNQADLFGDTLPDEAADRSRATMWDVPRFAEVHRYRAVITENVVDAAKWVMFDAWLMAMKSLGYEHRIQYLNSMHAQHGGLPAPQSRDRMYVLFWLKGNKAPDVEKYFRPKAYCSSCDEVVEAIQVFKKAEQWGRYRAQYVYRCPKVACRNQIVEPGWLPASHAIDWSLKGQRIGDRKKDLSPQDDGPDPGRSPEVRRRACLHRLRPRLPDHQCRQHGTIPDADDQLHALTPRPRGGPHGKEAARVDRRHAHPDHPQRDRAHSLRRGSTC